MTKDASSDDDDDDRVKDGELEAPIDYRRQMFCFFYNFIIDK